VNDKELIANAYSLLARGRVDAAEGYFERYLADRVRVVNAGPLREAWRKDVAERHTQLAAREQAERERTERGGGGLRRMLSRR
jgi:hypothetical protein